MNGASDQENNDATAVFPAVNGERPLSDFIDVLEQRAK